MTNTRRKGFFSQGLYSLMNGMADKMSSNPQQKSFFNPGENCWQVMTTDRAAFLVDGEDYYRAVSEAFEAAQRSIYILGWDVDSRVRLCRDSEEEETFGQLLNRLARDNPQLKIYVLEWDFAVFYSLEREFWSLFSIGWMTHERVHFELDDSHPAGASQHQKIIVVDDHLAFVGGFDLASFRWDTSEHRPQHPQRCDNDTQYGPVHDVQMLVTGEIAQELGELARWRWERATGESLSTAEHEAKDLWPASVSVDFSQQPLASYLLGRWLGRDAVQKLAGKKVNQLRRKLARRGWLTIALIRVVPIAPFTVVNMVAGASLISARSFIIGTVVGMCPGILAIMIFEEGLERALRNPDWETLGLALLAMVGGVLVLVVGKQLLLKKSERDHD